MKLRRIESTYDYEDDEGNGGTISISLDSDIGAAYLDNADNDGQVIIERQAWSIIREKLDQFFNAQV